VTSASGFVTSVSASHSPASAVTTARQTARDFHGRDRSPRPACPQPCLPLGVAASAIRNVVYFGGHATDAYLWTLAAWALAGVGGLILITALRRPAPALTEPIPPPVALAEPVSAHVPHQVIGSVPVRLLHESPYPVLTIP
jgi:hypothetical protein